MNEPAVVPSGQSLAEHYELLRKDVLDCDRHTHRVRGLALLMRNGMAAWMKGVGELPVSIAASAAPPAGPPLPTGIERHLVDILATMALASA